MLSKASLIAVTSTLAFVLSWALRNWGVNHPDQFLIRPFLVLTLVFGPALLLGFWVVYVGFMRSDDDSL